MSGKIWLTLNRKADGVWLYLHAEGGKSGMIHCGSPGWMGGGVSDLIDAAIAAGEFIPNPEEAAS